MGRGQQSFPWITTLKPVLPVTNERNGVFLEVYQTEYFAEPERLFQAAIEPAVIGNLYSLDVSVDCDYNIDFTLRCHIDGQDDVIQAEIRCTSSGFIEFRSGSFVDPIKDDRRTKWLMRSANAEFGPSVVMVDDTEPVNDKTILPTPVKWTTSTQHRRGPPIRPGSTPNPTGIVRNPTHA